MPLVKNYLNKTFSTPGPGSYFKSESLKPPWREIPIQCFISGAELCNLCADFLFGDYYKGKLTLCLSCFQIMGLKLDSKVYQKVRHCRCVHQHIGVPDIVYHKTTLRRIKDLEKKEKIMLAKYGYFA